MWRLPTVWRLWMQSSVEVHQLRLKYEPGFLGAHARWQQDHLARRGEKLAPENPVQDLGPDHVQVILDPAPAAKYGVLSPAITRMNSGQELFDLGRVAAERGFTAGFEPGSQRQNCGQGTG